MSKIAMLLTQEFEDSEAQAPLDALREAGHEVEIIGPAAGQELKGKKGQSVLRSDLAIAGAKSTDYDMLLIPGGHSPEQLRMAEGAVEFVREFGACGKPIAAICHGPQLLISADLVKGRRMTCFESIAVDLQNAGARYEDSALVVDGPFITSRKPDDLPQFCDAIVHALAGDKVQA